MYKIAFTAASLLVLHTAMAQQGVPQKKVTVFKNGTALIVNEGTVPVNGKLATLPDPGSVLLGTYWIGAPKGNTVKRADVKTDTLKVQGAIGTIPQMLMANTGKKVTLSYTAGDRGDRSITGTILSVSPAANLVQLRKDDNKVTALQTSAIYQVDMDNSPLSFTKDSIARMVVVELENSVKETVLKELYMQDGLNWTPSYLLKIADDKTAYLEMKATLTNPGKRMTDVETELVVGSPVLYFGAQRDPMSFDFVQMGVDVATAKFRMSQLSNNVVMAETSVAADGATAPDDFSREGEKQGDFYIYKLGKISLPKQATATFPIFTGTIACKEKYSCTIPDNVGTYQSGGDESIDGGGFAEVYHAYEIKNTLNKPFTTAPVMLMDQQGNFLAQNQLKYTPVGADNSIQISRAIDITLQNKEEETARVDNFKKVGKAVYGKVTVTGTVTINNFQQKDVSVNVKKCVNGAVDPLSDGGSVVKRKTQQGDKNPYSEMNWQLALKAGEKKVVRYTYQVLVN